MWDHAGDGGPLSGFWRAARDLDPRAPGEGDLAGSREGQLVALSHEAGLRQVDAARLAVDVRVGSFDAWWEPFTLGVGPAGAYVAGLDDEQRAALRARCAELLPEAPFTVRAVAWSVRATVPA